MTSHGINRRFCVAPMLDWTDKHCRYFHRLLSKNALLYTEMITTGALIYGDAARFLNFNPQEHPLALQLGGSCPKELAICAKLAQSYYYDEINLNIGCPSDRVQHGRFGACLMAQPQLVANCVQAMRETVDLPITVKCRIGIDKQDSYEQLVDFINTVAQAGCHTFIIHARKAWLNGLSPKENREIPPLRYDIVYQIKKQRPDLEIIINGGISSLTQAQTHLQYVDGVMLGREVYARPYLLAQVDNELFNANTPPLSRQQIIMALLPYIEQQIAQGRRLNSITRHILGLFHGEYGAKQWRRLLSENVHLHSDNAQLVMQALALTVRTIE